MKLAVCFGQNADGTGRAVERMLIAQSLRKGHRAELFKLQHGAIGRVACAEQHSRVPLFRRAANGNLLLLSGVPIHLNAPLDHFLEMLSSGDYRAAVLGLPILEGAFAAIFWDEQNRKLVVVTDFLGLQPLYIARRNGSFFLSTELKGITAALAMPVEMDPAGWGGFISFGHFLGNTTSVAGVRRVQPACVLVFDPVGGSLEERVYPHPMVTETSAQKPDTAALVELLRREIEAYAVHWQPGTVLLSGGFDSRLILSLLKGLNMLPEALNVSHGSERLDADRRYARDIATRFSVNCQFQIPSPGFFSSDVFLDYMVMNDVATPSLQLFIAQVSAHVLPEMGAVWEGVGPGFALAFPHIPSPDLPVYLKHRCQASGSPAWQAAGKLFARHRDIHDAFQETLAAAVAACPNGDCGLLQFEARHQMRNRMAHNPLKVYANDVLCFTPGIGKEFWSLAASIPYREKWGFKLYREIFRRHFPEAMKTPFCSMGQLYRGGRLPDASYYAAQFFPPPGARLVANALKRLGWDRSRHAAVVERVISRVDPDHPDLCHDLVAAIKRRQVPHDQVTNHARLLLFYWQVWRWVMEGALSISRKDVLEEVAPR